MSKKRSFNHEVIDIRECKRVQVQLWMMVIVSGAAFCFFWFMHQVSDVTYIIPAMTFAAGMMLASIRALRISRTVTQLFSLARMPENAVGLDPRNIPEDAFIRE